MYKSKTGVYYASLTENGNRTRKSTRTTDKRTAQRIEAAWRLEAANKRFEVVDAKVGDILDARHGDVMKPVRDDFGALTVAELTPNYLSCYIETHKHLDVKTIRRRLSHLSGILTWAGRTERWRGLPNPIKGNLPSVSQHDHRIRWEEKVVVMNIAENAPEAVRDAIVLAAYTGMRQGEILALTWNRVDLQRRIVHLRPEDQKNRRFGVVALNQVAFERVMNRKRHDLEYGSVFGLSKAQLQYEFRKACTAARVKDFRFHDLRHCFCSWLAMAGAELNEIREAARHQDLRTTLKYTHLRTDAVASTVARLTA